jgi:hypothetical protein
MDIVGRKEEPSMTGPRSSAGRRSTDIAYDSPGVSLVDLWSILYRRRRIAAGIFAVVVIVGGVLAFTSPRSYSFTTSIETGARLLADDRLAPIESTETVVAKIKESYIPLALQDALKRDASFTSVDLDASIPKNSQLIVLRSRGPIESGQTYVELHRAVLRYLTADHDRILAVIRNGIELTMADATRKVGQLRDEARRVQGQINRVTQDEALVLKEIGIMNGLVATATENRDKAVRETKDEAHAMTLLMLTDEIRQSRVRLMQLERRVSVELPNERDTLLKLVADNQRAQAEQAKLIESIQLQLTNLHETRAVTPTMQSLRPVGTSRSTMLGLWAVVGLVAAVLGALVVHSYSSTRDRMRVMRYIGTADDAPLDRAFLATPRVPADRREKAASGIVSSGAVAAAFEAKRHLD